jgi:hypothetical protein
MFPACLSGTHTDGRRNRNFFSSLESAPDPEAPVFFLTADSVPTRARVAAAAGYSKAFNVLGIRATKMRTDSGKLGGWHAGCRGFRMNR